MLPSVNQVAKTSKEIAQSVGEVTEKNSETADKLSKLVEDFKLS